MDLSYLVKQIKEPSSGLRLRQAEVIVHNNTTPKSVDVKIAGDSNILPAVKYLNSFNPTVGDTVWLISNGADVLCIGNQAK
jgi:hypothetical protein